MANTQIPHIQSHTTSAQDIWYKPPSQGTNGEEYIVYFVPGNPCIMTYYEPFLAKLFSTLNTALASRKLSTHIGGYTLPGFRLKPGTLEHIQPPFSLQDQVKHTEDLITFALKEHVELTTVSDGAQRPKVILVSHSMGTYITHEILKRHASGEHGLSNVDIVGAVLICAPLFEMAQTKNGAVVDRLTQLPGFPTFMGLLAKMLTFFLPLSLLCWIIRVPGRTEPHTARAAAEFMKVPYAVRQAMCLLRDLCRDMKKDHWVGLARSKSVQLKFYFAKDDEWISSGARDAFIATCARTEDEPWKPEMVIDNKIIHGFNENTVIREIVAAQVATMVEDIIAVTSHQ